MPSSNENLKVQLEALNQIIRKYTPALVSSVSAVISGITLMADDYRDINIKKLLERPHHFTWGFLLTIAGLVGSGLTSSLILAELIKIMGGKSASSRS